MYIKYVRLFKLCLFWHLCVDTRKHVRSPFHFISNSMFAANALFVGARAFSASSTSANSTSQMHRKQTTQLSKPVYRQKVQHLSAKTLQQQQPVTVEPSHSHALSAKRVIRAKIVAFACRIRSHNRNRNRFV